MSLLTRDAGHVRNEVVLERLATASRRYRGKAAIWAVDWDRVGCRNGVGWGTPRLAPWTAAQALAGQGKRSRCILRTHQPYIPDRVKATQPGQLLSAMRPCL